MYLLNNRLTGRYNEEKAVSYLISNQYEILIKNYYSLYGEIDIIAKRYEFLIFFEVKSSRSQYIDLRYKINKKKQLSMKNTALTYISDHNLSNYQIQFDLIILELTNIKHLKNIFSIY